MPAMTAAGWLSFLFLTGESLLSLKPACRTGTAGTENKLRLKLTLIIMYVKVLRANTAYNIYI